MSDSAPTRLGESIKGLAETGLATLQTRIELLAVEVKEEKLRVGSFLFETVLAALFVGFGFVFLLGFLTVLLWDSHRLLVLGLAAAVFLLAGAGAAMTARRLAGTPAKLFEASLEELKRDQLRAEVSGKSQSP